MPSQEPSVPRRRNPRGQGEVLKAQLVDATAKLLATLDQPETLTLRQVAREVGVAPASIYSHFTDLSALIQHVLRLRYQELARLMDEAAQVAGPAPLADLTARCAAYVHWGVSQPGHYRTLFGGRMPADLVPGSAHGAGAEPLTAVVTSLAAAAVPERKQPTAERQAQAGLMLWTALHGLVSLYNDHGMMPWPPLNDLITDVVCLHTGRPAAETASLLRQHEGRFGPPTRAAHKDRDTALLDPSPPAGNEHGVTPEAG
ncbi:TetR/AcrR family transcriptional regulator [Streptomyces angustmyceticus]|uniref:TetR/AcrR family transcriptional regulator n=1 Tax=Streptomyces angustmyceticus TaxID=285578 RepID=UPI00344D27FD